MSTKKEQYQNRRATLQKLSLSLKPLIDEGVYPTVNAAIVDYYRSGEGNHEEFKTLREWNKEGKRIKKGSKAFVVWGSPKKSNKAKEGEQQQEETEELEFFPLCYLFSNQQVEERTIKTA